MLLQSQLRSLDRILTAFSPGFFQTSVLVQYALLLLGYLPRS